MFITVLWFVTPFSSIRRCQGFEEEAPPNTRLQVSTNDIFHCSENLKSFKTLLTAWYKCFPEWTYSTKTLNFIDPYSS
jgi:hypothetical protein